MPDGPHIPGATSFEPLPIRGADAASFEVLNALYARDAGMVYYRSGKVPKADPASFRVLDPGFFEGPAEGPRGAPSRHFQGYARDDRAVFHYVLTIGVPATIRGADLESFEPLLWGFARDGDRVYHEKTPAKGAKPDDFRQLNRHYSLTSRSAYHFDRPIVGSDPGSFRILAGATARDDRAVYLVGRPIEHADPATYEVVGISWVGKDRSTVYAHGLPVEGADPETFVHLGGAYHKDKARAYFGGKPIPKADLGSFRYVRENYAEDDRRLYNSGYASPRVHAPKEAGG